MLSLKLKIILVLAIIAALGGCTYAVWHNGYATAEADQTKRENDELKKYIDANARLTKLVDEYKQADQKVSTTNAIVYLEDKNATEKAVNDAVAAVESRAIRLRVTIRDYEARAATAELAASTVGAFATRQVELHQETATALIRLTGDADKTADTLNALQREVIRLEKGLSDYNKLVSDFYKQEGYIF